VTRRLLATARCDVLLQLRNGFYAVTAAVVAVWVVLLSQLPPGLVDAAWLLPPLLAGNLLLSTFYFVGGLVLLEKAEGTLGAQAVTPLRSGEYLAAKVLSLGLLSLAENVALALVLYGRGLSPAPLVLGLSLAAAVHVLAGFAAVVRYDSVNTYLLPSVVYATATQLPIVAYVAGWDGWLLWLHPLQGPLVLLRASVAPVGAGEVAAASLLSAGWIAGGGLWAGRSFRRFVAERAGG
jgi:fluoroquinolone transport system permease protein